MDEEEKLRVENARLREELEALREQNLEIQKAIFGKEGARGLFEKHGLLLTVSALEQTIRILRAAHVVLARHGLYREVFSETDGQEPADNPLDDIEL